MDLATHHQSAMFTGRLAVAGPESPVLRARLAGSGAEWTIWAHLGPFGPKWAQIGPTGPVWAHLDQKIGFSGAPAVNLARYDPYAPRVTRLDPGGRLPRSRGRVFCSGQPISHVWARRSSTPAATYCRTSPAGHGGAEDIPRISEVNGQQLSILHHKSQDLVNLPYPDDRHVAHKNPA